MVALLSNNTKYSHCKLWLMLGVSSAANSECAYLMMAEMPEHVVDD
jgi:hypothetical protein